MALISPGVDVTVIDESQYAPSGGGTVPFIVIATEQDKVGPSGSGIAAGTTAANADAVAIVTSQRELASLYGNPIFKQTSTGTPIHGSELNEYGLMAAYSVLGVTNRVYVQRADIDLAQLEGTNVRPTNSPADGTYWLDTSTTNWGIFEWNLSTNAFEHQEPIVITSSNDLTAGVPKESIGNIGQYAVNATNVSNPVYYKRYDNSWVLVGTSSWEVAHPAVQSTTSTPSLSVGDTIVINGTTVTLTGTTVSSTANDINTSGITGISASISGSTLNIFVESTSESDGANADGIMDIAEGSGTALADLGITAGSYLGASVLAQPHTSVPRWKATDDAPRPTGSVWIKTSSANLGASFAISRYSLATDSFVAVNVPVFNSIGEVLYTLDPQGGGLNIAEGSVHVLCVAAPYPRFIVSTRAKQGTTTVVGSNTSATFTIGDQFTLETSLTGTTATSGEYTVNVTGTTVADVVADILAANVPDITASVTASGALLITHTKGGYIFMDNVSGTPLTDAGITTSSDYVSALFDGRLIASNFVQLTYTAGDAAPNSDPTDGRLWYWSDAGEVDIMIHDGSSWVGYHNETADARGYNLSNTDPSGVIVSASEPLLQSDGSGLVFGDLWLDTSDLENFPVIRRYSNVGGTAGWVLLDNGDQTTENGIVFGDARWDTDGTSNVVVGEVTPVADMLTSDYVDLDCPDPVLYPRGTLLFNTRRSSFNVKRFAKNYFNENDFTGTMPSERDTWVSAAGLQDDGSPYMGRKAVRHIVVTAMKAAVASSTELREEQRQFTLMSAPGYPEMIPSLIALNNDRRNTAFVVGDTPLRLSSSATDVQNWANNVANKGTGEDGLSVSDPYTAVYYPAAQTNDLEGNSVVVPASHVALRTIVRSDAVSYPWFAAAGVRRGLVDNASSLGYVDATTGEFNTMGVTEGLRDTCYESRINPITYLTGVGLAVYGQKTIGVTGSALDRINVSRLVVYLRRVIDLASRNFVFEPNDKITRDELKQVIERALNDLVAKRALTDYLVVCDESNNTPIRRDRNELYVDVAIEPVKSAEFIYIPLRIKSQGAISGS